MLADFSSLCLSPSLLEVLKELGYTTPTPIQQKSIPVLLAGKDLIGQSETGSGKTAAFALPILQNIKLNKRRLQALILCPTRELCAQVAREIRTLGRKEQSLAVLEIVGGQPMRPQICALERGVHIAVGTPGRLLDHHKRGTLPCRQITTVVLDEADRMLDMGFGADVEAILNTLPKSRQTVLFSATFPDTVKAISGSYQRKAVTITVASQAQDTETLLQYFVTAKASNKLQSLYWVLDHFPHESALIFCNFKASVRELEQALTEAGCSVGRLDGDLEQFERDQVLAKFRNQSIRILIATDVAGRGIDVKDLELIINFELPAKPDIYVHRIGRTARAGKEGVAISLVTPRESSRLRSFEKVVGSKIKKQTPTTSKNSRFLARHATMTTILISGGRKDKIRPGDILGALTGDAGGLRGDQIGKIEIHDRLSYVAVASSIGARAAKSINAGRIKAKRFRATLV